MVGDAPTADRWRGVLMNLVAIAALAFSALTSIIAITAVIVQMRTNVERLTKRETEHEEREDKAAREVTELVVLLKTFIAEQTQINKTVEFALTGVINQLREMEKRTVEASTVVSLLTEVLRKAKGIELAP